MIDEVVVEPLAPALNALSLEILPLGYGVAPLVLDDTHDTHPVQAELYKNVVHQHTTYGGHESLALELLSKPVA